MEGGLEEYVACYVGCGLGVFVFGQVWMSLQLDVGYDLIGEDGTAWESTATDVQNHEMVVVGIGILWSAEN